MLEARIRQARAEKPILLMTHIVLGYPSFDDSRRLVTPPRGRLVLHAFLGVFTIAIAAVLMRSGFHQVDQVVNEPGEHLIEKKDITKFLPIGCGLIIVHALLHLVIDADYLVRNKLPPERARSGH